MSKKKSTNRTHSRREFLHGGLVAAGTLVPALSLAQGQVPPETPTPPASSSPMDQAGTTLSQAMSQLTDGSLPTYQQTSNAFSLLGQAVSEANSALATQPFTAELYDVSEEWDFYWIEDNDPPVLELPGVTVPSYQNFVAEEYAFAQTLPSDATLYAMTPTFQDEGGLSAGLRLALSKVLGVLGLKEIWQAVLDILETYYKTLWTAFWRAIKEKRWKDAIKFLTQLIKKMMSKRFKQVLIGRVGKSVAAKIIGKLAAKFVPVLGWAVVVGEIVWAVAEQYINLFSNAEPTLQPATA